MFTYALQKPQYYPQYLRNEIIKFAFCTTPQQTNANTSINSPIPECAETTKAEASVEENNKTAEVK